MILQKIISESLLSLYPSFVKNIKVSLDKQLLTRLMGYSLVPLLFVSYAFLQKNIFSKTTFILSLVTFIHIFFSYKGFKILDSGIAYTIFYLYPIMLLFWKDKSFSIFYIITIIGLLLLTVNISDLKKLDPRNYNNKKVKGVIYVLLATITEVMIYYLVRGLNTDNQWNTIFLSYFPAFIIFGIYYLFHNWDTIFEKTKFNFDPKIFLLLGFNIIVGLVGYYFRFVSMKKLSIKVYGTLSYLGIIFSYIYGYVFNKEKIQSHQIIGTILIIFSNFMLLK